MKLCANQFLVRIEPLVKKFRGKFLFYLQQYYSENKLHFSKSCQNLRNHYAWNEFKNKLYATNWNAEIKETFNGNGNAIEYLGRYANRIAITNTRILSVSEKEVSFRAKDYKNKEQKVVTISCVEFIRRFMMHVLPSGFQKIRCYGFLNNRWKSKNLAIIFRIQGCKDLDMDRETFLRYSRDTIQRLDKGILCRLLAYFEVGISDLISYERKDVVK